MNKKYRFWVFLLLSILVVLVATIPLKPAKGAYLEIPRLVSVGELLASSNNPIKLNNQFWGKLIKKNKFNSNYFEYGK